MRKLLILIAAALLCASLAAQTPVQNPMEVPTSADSLSTTTATIETPVTDASVSANVLWDQANTAYINADYHTAAVIYNQILDRGLSSSKLYYNLANTYFKTDDLGKAILFYNRALRLTPGNEDLRYNLNVAESRTKDTIESIPEFFAISWLRALRHTMGCTSWSIVSLSALVLMFACILLYLLSQRISLRKMGFYGTLCTLIIGCITTAFALSERREILDRTEAIVMSSSVSVKSSPDGAATDIFVLHEGTKVRVTDRLEEWCEISIADGKKGWLEGRQIEII